MVTITNFWIWRIAEIDLIFCLALILLSVILFYLFTNYRKRILFIFLLLLIYISIKVLISGFDNNLSTLFPDQQKQLNQRHGYYADDLGIFFKNKFTLRLYRDVFPYLNIYTSNIFNSLSPNLYFFANHPREREKVEEFSMYPSVLVIPFLIGLIRILSLLNYTIIGYILFAIFVTGFVKQNFIFGPIMFFPLVNLFISLGFFQIYNLLHKK